VLLPFRPMAENSSHPLCGWSLTHLLRSIRNAEFGLIAGMAGELELK